MKRFHPSRAARARYAIESTLFAANGDLVVANGPAARRLAARMNAARGPGESPVNAGDLAAMGLLHEIFHLVVERYQAEVRPAALAAGLDHLDARLGADAARLLDAFSVEFPGPGPHPEPRAVRLEELLLNRVMNENPAVGPLRELIDDAPLAASARYADGLAALDSFFAAQPPFGPEGETLLELLRAPARNAPGSLADQLRYIRERWRGILGAALDRLLRRIDVALGVLAEEARGRWLRFHGPGPDTAGVHAPSFAGMDEEPERFSTDLDWMPRLVLIAKSTYVWLHQLSRRHGRDIRTLDAIPDAELDQLARWGITGLWLIGVWERSPASERIKRMMGNPDAAASAYSLLDYRIAADLGGEAALADLRERAWRRGIRMAADMVPNHVGIASRWVVQHPDWFLSLRESPYPAYSFTGADLSGDERVGIRIEDHYWDHSDAAVVFQRVDRWTGDVRYIYHGNDGTSVPWNDTAQLDYRRADAREAVIRTILHVARQFPVIRFDAAMTLTKRHIQRLWFPLPGSGDAVPSRAEHGLTKEEFDAAMPVEFWREVVDRVAAEAPDTLLLAEAFWMLEGYFVRTLGMHRVYNSAFMHMLRDEDNAGYRRVLKDTLEFDPEILKRYVNFMSNPDEKMAVEQFGKGDKYFGVCTLMATLPGLPMFGHGQIEGFAEKYGMEYRRPRQDETADEGLVRTHEQRIFPLLHRRALFAEVRSFLLYDVFAPDGGVNEDVFAFSNARDGERALVVYHNRFADARGWIRTSAAYAAKDGGGAKALRQRTLGEGLALSAEEGRWVVFRDAVAGREYLRESRKLVDEGLWVDLGAYACHVFVDFRELVDGPTGQLRRLAERLGGAGVPSVEDALRAQQLEPVHRPLLALLDAKPADVPERYAAFLDALADATGVAKDERTRRDLVDAAGAELAGSDEPVLRAWSLLRRIGALADPAAGAAAAARTSRAWFDELRMQPVVSRALRDDGLLRTLLALPDIASLETPRRRPQRLCALWFADDAVRAFLRVNRWDGAEWFHRETFEALTDWLVRLDAIGRGEPAQPEARRVARAMRRAAAVAGYRVDRLLHWAARAEARAERPVRN